MSPHQLLDSRWFSGTDPGWSLVEMEFSPDGQVLAVISEDGTLKLIDVNSSK